MLSFENQIMKKGDACWFGIPNFWL